MDGSGVKNEEVLRNLSGQRAFRATHSVQSGQQPGGSGFLASTHARSGATLATFAGRTSLAESYFPLPAARFGLCCAGRGDAQPAALRLPGDQAPTWSQTPGGQESHLTALTVNGKWGACSRLRQLHPARP